MRLLRQLLRIAARRLGVLFDRHLEEYRTQALDLFFHRRPHIKGRDDRAEPPRRRDCLQSRDPGAEDEDPGGGQRACGGHEHREDTARGRGREQHGLVAGDRRLR